MLRPACIPPTGLSAFRQVFLTTRQLVPRAETFGPICRHAAKGLPVLVHLNGFAMVRLK
jgi:hypothetical protein